jgi:hypothetical protein
MTPTYCDDSSAHMAFIHGATEHRGWRGLSLSLVIDVRPVLLSLDLTPEIGN